MDFQVGRIILTVLGCIIQIGVLCLIGYVCAVRGIIDKDTRRQLNRLNVSIFTPALLFGKVAFSLTPQTLAKLWIIPLGYIVLTIVSALAAWALGKIARLPKSRLNLAIAGAMFMNSNTLPIALMQTLSTSLSSLNWKSDDTPELLLDRSLQYLVVCTTIGSIFRWSFGIKLIASADNDGSETRPNPQKALQRRSDVLCSEKNKNEVAEASGPIPHGNKQCPAKLEDSTESPPMSSPWLSRAAIQCNEAKPGTNSLGLDSTRCMSPPPGRSCIAAPDDRVHRIGLPEQPAHVDPHVLELGCAEQDSFGSEKSDRKSQSMGRRRGKLVSNLKRAYGGSREVLNPPLLSSLAAIVVACIPPLQKGLGKVEPIRNFFTVTGAVAIPLTLVVLGAFFHRSSPSKQQNVETQNIHEERKKRFQSLRNFKENFKDVAVTLLARHIVTPLVMLPILAILCQRISLEILKDPVFLLVSSLIIGSPPAITLAQLTTKASGDLFEALVSRLLFWSYFIVTPPTTIALVIASLLIQKSAQST